MNWDLLKRLCDAPGVSGYEDAVRDIIIREVGSHADDVTVDHIGNLYMTRGHDKPGPHLMIAAHTDEVGLMVESINEQGFIKFMPVGGVDPRVLPAKKVRLGTEGIPGIIGVCPPHHTNREDRGRVTPIEDLFIDIGASSRSQAESYIEPGSPIWFDTCFEMQGDICKAKAFDDRAGCFMIAELIKHRFPFPVTFTWTVQEEVGLRGARMAAARVQPDIFIALEGTGAGDVPVGGKDLPRNPELGKGPVITILDRTAVCDEDLVSLLTETADQSSIPWQYKRPLIGGTDAGAAVRVKALRAAVIAVPSRYIHSPVALASGKDIINTIELVKASAGRMKEVLS